MIGIYLKWPSISQEVNKPKNHKDGQRECLEMQIRMMNIADSMCFHSNEEDLMVFP